MLKSNQTGMRWLKALAAACAIAAFIIGVVNIPGPGMSFGRSFLKWPGSDCQIVDQIKTLEGFGRVRVGYSTPIFTGIEREWYVDFESDKTTGFKFEISERDANVCVAMALAYNKVMQVPLVMKQK